MNMLEKTKNLKDIIKNMIKTIKEKIFKKQQKLLTETTVDAAIENKQIYSSKQQRKDMQEDLRNNVPEIKYDTIEFAIDQYLMSLSMIYEETGKLNSYKALINLGGLEENESNDNRQKEQFFISEIKNCEKNKYDIIEQIGKTSELPSFYHISTKGYNYEIDGKETVRLYINLKRENVIDFSKQLMDELEGQGFYFKIPSEQQMENTLRSEKIIIYCKKDDLQEKVKAIRNIKSKYPKLLEKSEYTNPFLEKIDGYIAYAPNLKEGKYIKQDGTEVETKSFNDFLSEGLLEAFTEGCNRLVQGHKEITNGKVHNDPNVYINYYTHMEDYNDELIYYIKQELEKQKDINPALKYTVVGRTDKDSNNYRDGDYEKS